MSRAAERGQTLLDALGKPARRPGRKAPAAWERLCLRCQRQITLARLQAGAWCSLDREPDGDMVIVGAFVRTRGDHHADAPRYSFHRCTPKENPNGHR